MLNTQTMKEAALELAGLGFRVHPLYPIGDHLQCTCYNRDCQTIGKHPRLQDWVTNATSQPSIVALWWDAHPDDGIGIATGDGLVVVDLDNEDAINGWSDLGSTWAVKTGRGMHLYYRTNEQVRNSAGRLGTGIDVRGEGGYVVAPPTLHKSGARYSWIAGVPEPGERAAQLPQAVLDKLLDGPGPVFEPIDWEVGEDGICGWPFGTLAMGDRNVSMTRYVGALYRADMNDDEVFTLAREANAAYLSPPLSERELGTIVRSISRRDERTRELRDSDPLMPMPHVPQSNVSVVNNKPSKFKLITASTVKTEGIEWVWPGYLGRKLVTNLSGDGGVGKSVLTADLAARLSTGVGWPDGSPCEVGSTVFLNAEDDASTVMVPRLRAAGGDLTRIHLAPDLMRFPADLDELASLISHLEPSLLVIDPIMAFLDSRIDPNDQARVTMLLTKISAMAIAQRCAVLIVQHLRKQEGQAVYKTSGSTAWISRSRVGLQVVKDKNEKGRCLFTHTKGNYTQDMKTWAYSKINENGHPVLRWETDPVDIDADAALNDPSKDERTAAQWLRLELSSGPVGLKLIEERARDAGIGAIDITRARLSLRATTVQSATGHKMLALPGFTESVNPTLSVKEHDEWT